MFWKEKELKLHNNLQIVKSSLKSKRYKKTGKLYKSRKFKKWRLTHTMKPKLRGLGAREAGVGGNQKKERQNTVLQSLLRMEGVGLNWSKIFLRKLGINMYSSWKDLDGDLKKKDSWANLLKNINKKRGLKFKDTKWPQIRLKLRDNLWPLIGDHLWSENKNSFKRKVSLKYKLAIRLKQGFPVRGQRTRSNACTARRLNGFR